MDLMIKKRRGKRLSQRALASEAGVSFRTIQLLESGKHDTKLSTLERIVASFGYPKDAVVLAIRSIFSQPPDSIAMISERILSSGESSWKLWLFNFVDAFREQKDPSYISTPPAYDLSEKVRALISSTVEALCEELKIAIPWWCLAINPLAEPWFVAGIENLKTAALLESPIYFRKRNIFVLENFLARR